MNTIESYCFLIMCGLVAYVFTILYFYLIHCYKNWRKKTQLKRQYKNDLFRQRCKHLHNHFKDYYYTLAVNNPKLLATEIADACVSRVTRKNLVYESYSRIASR